MSASFYHSWGGSRISTKFFPPPVSCTVTSKRDYDRIHRPSWQTHNHIYIVPVCPPIFSIKPKAHSFFHSLLKKACFPPFLNMINLSSSSNAYSSQQQQQLHRSVVAPPCRTEKKEQSDSGWRPLLIRAGWPSSPACTTSSGWWDQSVSKGYRQADVRSTW